MAVLGLDLDLEDCFSLGPGVGEVQNGGLSFLGGGTAGVSLLQSRPPEHINGLAAVCHGLGFSLLSVEIEAFLWELQRKRPDRSD